MDDDAGTTRTFLGKTTRRSGGNGTARWLLGQALEAVTSGRIDYHPNANRKWCVGQHGRGYTLIGAALDAWRKRRLI